MTAIEDLSDRPFMSVCLALDMIGVDMATAAAEIEPPEDREDFRLAVMLSQGLTLELDHDASEGILTLAVLIADAGEKAPLLHHALAANDLLPPHRRISLRPDGALAVCGRLPSGSDAKAQSDEIAAEATDLARIAELLDATSDLADAPADVVSYSEDVIRG